jgi:hypothetical protein
MVVLTEREQADRVRPSTVRKRGEIHIRPDRHANRLPWPAVGLARLIVHGEMRPGPDRSYDHWRALHGPPDG